MSTDNIISNSALFNKKSHLKKSARCPLSEENAPQIDYKNLEVLKQYISEKGRIMPSRVSSISAKKQRELKQAIMRARNLALLPFTTK
jgi:small subunit ribosomal protein S18